MGKRLSLGKHRSLPNGPFLAYSEPCKGHHRAFFMKIPKEAMEKAAEASLKLNATNNLDEVMRDEELDCLSNFQTFAYATSILMTLHFNPLPSQRQPFALSAFSSD